MTEVLWGNLRAEELRELARRDAIVILPTASIEQHGPHLPVKVDTLLAGEVARRTALKLSSRTAAVAAPVVWSGLSEHHMDYGGTLTLTGETFARVLHDIVHSMVRHGFRRILVLNGHGGNREAVRTATRELTLAYGIPLACANYSAFAREEQARILERQKTSNHACEMETSMVLALEPELVVTERLDIARGPSEPELMDAVGEAVYRWQAFSARTGTGVLGDAGLASADKGERLLEAITDEIARTLLLPELWSLPISNPAVAE